jgi:hypothetical protein
MILNYRNELLDTATSERTVIHFVLLVDTHKLTDYPPA